MNTKTHATKHAKTHAKTHATTRTPYAPSPKLHISSRNTKIGEIPNLNLLPGDTHLKDKNFTTISGSCTGCCSSCAHCCYAMKSYRYPSALYAHADNTLYATTDITGFFNDLSNYLTKHTPKYFRYHSHGEIPSKEYFSHIWTTAIFHPSTMFYIYTKRYDWINELITPTNPKPSNLTILFSPPFTCSTKAQIDAWAKSTNPNNLPMFIYDDHTDPSIASIAHCPAVDSSGHKTGITCDKCQRCIKGLTTAVHAH